MRLTPEQRQIIREATRKVFGPDAIVWLFGSRVDDRRRGGDIDLYVEASIDDPTLRQVLEDRLFARLQRKLGEQRIDIVSRSPAMSPSPIHLEARRHGVRL
jgi:predicted nucleotidyltransferase